MAVVAAKHVQYHHALAMATLQRQGCRSGALSASRFNRRLHALADWFRLLLEPLGEPLASGDCFLIDSLPVPACKRARAGRCRTVRGRVYCAHCAAKREQVRGTRLRVGRLHLACASGTRERSPNSWASRRCFVG